MLFRAARTENYCSKCYTQLFAGDPKSHNIDLPKQLNSENEIQNVIKQNLSNSVQFLSKSGIENVNNDLPQSEFKITTRSQTKEKKICEMEGCRRKLSLTSVECRCGSTFCSVHRYAEKHDCPVDYKSQQKAMLSRANPLIVPNKINKI